jgi:membrane associated rhomboid family serine protease
MTKPIDVGVKKLILSMFFPFLFLLIIWLIFVSDITLDLELVYHGLYPRKPSGLQGIFLSPLIHSGFRHIFANSLPLFALGSLLFYFYQPMAFRVLLICYFLPGVAVWFIGRPSYHVGASGIIYGLAAFLFLSGLIRKHLGLMAVSLLVVIQYGTMVWGVLPLEEGVSWESHLSGMITGLLLAWFFRNKGPKGFDSYSQGLGNYQDSVSDAEAAELLPWDEFEVEGSIKKTAEDKDIIHP